MERRLEHAFVYVLPPHRRLGCKTSGKKIISTEFEGGVDTWQPSGSTPRDSVDFSVIFKVERDRVPVLFVEVKAFKNISSLSARKEADSQIRQRFIDFYDATPTVSTGISAFGHTICKYELNKEDNFVTPEAIPDSIKYIVDVAPRERWDLDLTTDVGGDRILAIFEQVKSRILAEGACQCNAVLLLLILMWDSYAYVMRSL